MKNIFILALNLIPHVLISSEDTPQAKTFQYNQKLTDQLQITFAKEPSSQRSEKVQRLICASADPNVKKDSLSLLDAAVLLDDVDVVQCCLDYGAKIDLSNRALPLFNTVASVAVLQCFTDHNVDLHKKIGGNTLLHSAATHRRSPEFMTFLCNAGLSTNEPGRGLSTPLHNLFCMLKYHDSPMQNVALFLWYDADLHTRKNIHGESPFEVARRLNPELVPQVQALGTVVPLVKVQHKKEYNNMLATHITTEPANLVMTYIEPSWGERCWPQISDDIAQQTGSPSEPIQKTESCMIPAKTQKSSWCNVS